MLGDTIIDPIDAVVANPDGFYPDLNLKDWQELYRVPGDSQAVLERNLLLAMGDCNGLLAAWKAIQVAAGGAALPADRETDYSEAVYARAYGFLLKILPALVLDDRSREQMETLGMTPGDYFDRSDQRLARITGAGAGRGGIIAVIG